MQSLSHQFLTFCRSKPADEEYDFLSMETCACAQFATELGATRGLWLSQNTNERVDGLLNSLHDRHGEWIDCLVANPQTFGALADRLEATLKRGSKA